MSDQNITGYSHGVPAAEIAAQRIVLALVGNSGLKLPHLGTNVDDAKALGEFLAVTVKTMAQELLKR